MSELKPCHCCKRPPLSDRGYSCCSTEDEGCWINFAGITLHDEDWNDLMLELARRESMAERAAFEAGSGWMSRVAASILVDRPDTVATSSQDAFDEWKASKG